MSELPDQVSGILEQIEAFPLSLAAPLPVICLAVNSRSGRAKRIGIAAGSRVQQSFGWLLIGIIEWRQLAELRHLSEYALARRLLALGVP